MKSSRLRSFTFALVTAPLALGLAACGKKDAEGAASGEKIAPIAAPAGKNWAETIVKTADGGYLVGNPDAPIKVLEFAALSCSHCADFSVKSTPELKDTFVASGRVSYELRLFMLNAIDMPAALLVTCGAPETVPALGEQFWAWQPTMFENLLSAPPAQQQAIESLPPAQRIAAVGKLAGMDTFINSRGISADQSAICLTDAKKTAEFAAQTTKWGEEFNITGTPTFIINGEKSDINAWPELKARLEAMGAR